MEILLVGHNPDPFRKVIFAHNDRYYTPNRGFCQELFHILLYFFAVFDRDRDRSAERKGIDADLVGGFAEQHLDRRCVACKLLTVRALHFGLQKRWVGLFGIRDVICLVVHKDQPSVLHFQKQVDRPLYKHPLSRKLTGERFVLRQRFHRKEHQRQKEGP